MNMAAERIFDWFLRISWQAALLVVIVLGVQWLFRRRLSPRWRYALWSVVLLKLMLPSAPQTEFSLYNLVPMGFARERQVVPAADPGSSDGIQGFRVVSGTAPLTGEVFGGDRGRISAATLWETAILIWLAGVSLLTTRLIGQALAFSRLLRGASRVSNAEVATLFDTLKFRLGVARSVRLVQTDLVASPALYGYFRPRLLLPARMMAGFSLRELQHVFLHELAHVKRHDMLVLWLVSVLRILHWFNPVLWLGFRQMAADRELACDELALSHAEAEERKPYGETILRLLQLCGAAPTSRGTVGILEDKSEVVRRVVMIANFKRRPFWSPTGVVILTTLGLVALTEARSQVEEAAVNKDGPVSSAAASGLVSENGAVPSGGLQAHGLSPGDGGAGIAAGEGGSRGVRVKPDEPGNQSGAEAGSAANNGRNEVSSASKVDLQSLRDQLTELDRRKADLESQIQAEMAKNRATALEAFRKRYGLPPAAVSAANTNGHGAREADNTRAREEFLRRYGLDPNQVARAGAPGTNSAEQARAAFLRRYGLVNGQANSVEPNSRTAPPSDSRTSFSSRNLPLRLNVDHEGALRFAGEREPVSLDEVKARFADEMKRDPSLRLSVSADRKAPFGQIIKIMDAAKEAKINAVDAVIDEAQANSSPRP